MFIRPLPVVPYFAPRGEYALGGFCIGTDAVVCNSDGICRHDGRMRGVLGGAASWQETDERSLANLGRTSGRVVWHWPVPVA